MNYRKPFQAWECPENPARCFITDSTPTLKGTQGVPGVVVVSDMPKDEGDALCALLNAPAPVVKDDERTPDQLMRDSFVAAGRRAGSILPAAPSPTASREGEHSLAAISAQMHTLALKYLAEGDTTTYDALTQFAEAVNVHALSTPPPAEAVGNPQEAEEAAMFMDNQAAYHESHPGNDQRTQSIEADNRMAAYFCLAAQALRSQRVVDDAK